MAYAASQGGLVPRSYMCLCMCVCVCVSVYVSVYVYINMHACMYTSLPPEVSDFDKEVNIYM